MSKKDGNILIVDDDPGVLQTAKFTLKQSFTNVIATKEPREIPFHLNESSIDVVLLDMNFQPGVTSGSEGLKWLKEISGHESQPSVIMITAYGEISLAVEAMKYGAVDFVIKPWENEKLLATVNSAHQLARSKREVEELKEINRELSNSAPGNDMVLGNSQRMQDLKEMIDKVAPTDADVLIYGENGTGKELVAQMIHQRSMRSDKPLIKVDVGAITETLFESELFGHVKGAFTDAKADKVGRFELASGGTLFLDEIGNLGKDVQSKLLSALQNREVFRVGSSKPVSIDIRLICATNTPLSELVSQGAFREDLYYRLNTIEMQVPALRDRLEDLPQLVAHFLEKYGGKYGRPGIHMSQSAMKELAVHPWPGNVRELEHAIERAVILSESGQSAIEIAPIPTSRVGLGSREIDSLNMEEVEKKTIETAIALHQGNMSKVAAELGMGRTTLYRKLKRYGL